MKFAKFLETHMITRWRQYHIDYKKLKKLLGRLKDVGAARLPAAEVAAVSRLFVSALQDQVEAVNHFVVQQLRDLGAERSSIAAARAAAAKGTDGAVFQRLREREAAAAATEADLRDFLELNYACCYKALKKHDKLTGLGCQAPCMQAVEAQPFVAGMRLLAAGRSAATAAASLQHQLNATETARSILETATAVVDGRYVATTNETGSSSADDWPIATRSSKRAASGAASGAAAAAESPIWSLREADEAGALIAAFDSTLQEALAFLAEALQHVSPELSRDESGRLSRLADASAALTDLQHAVAAVAAARRSVEDVQSAVLAGRILAFPRVARILSRELELTVPEAVAALEDLQQAHLILLGPHATHRGLLQALPATATSTASDGIAAAALAAPVAPAVTAATGRLSPLQLPQSEDQAKKVLHGASRALQGGDDTDIDATLDSDSDSGSGSGSSSGSGSGSGSEGGLRSPLRAMSHSTRSGKAKKSSKHSKAKKQGDPRKKGNRERSLTYGEPVADVDDSEVVIEAGTGIVRLATSPAVPLQQQYSPRSPLARATSFAAAAPVFQRSSSFLWAGDSGRDSFSSSNASSDSGRDGGSPSGARSSSGSSSSRAAADPPAPRRPCWPRFLRLMLKLGLFLLGLQDSGLDGGGGGLDTSGSSGKGGRGRGPAGFGSRLWRRWRPAIFEWLPEYNWRKHVIKDMVAGIVVGVILIPQGLAYAALAGLPAHYGLYTGLPAILYCLLGTSRQTAIGPMSTTSLLIVNGVGAVVSPTTGLPYVQAVMTMTLMCGLLCLAAGFLQLGFIVRFISRPVLAGFASAAAILTIASSCEDMLGVKIPRSAVLQDFVVNIAQALPATNWATAVTGIVSVLLLILLPRARWSKALPAPLQVTALAILIFFGWMKIVHSDGTIPGPAVDDDATDDHSGGHSPDTYASPGGIELLGVVPAELPQPVWPDLPINDAARFLALFQTAVSVTFVGFLQSVAVANLYAAQHGYEVDPASELKAFGVVNVAGSALGAFPVMASFSRSAVNNNVGAQSQVSQVVSTITVLLLIVILTPALFWLPKAVLAAIIIVSAIGNIDIKAFKRLWKIDKRDWACMAAAFACTLCLGVVNGVVVAILVSLLLFISVATAPRVEELGRVPGTVVYRDVATAGVVRVPEVKVVRFISPLFFANSSVLKDRLRRELLLRRVMPPRLQFTALVLDCSAISSCDSTSVQVLEDLVAEAHKSGVLLLLCSLNVTVETTLRKAGVITALGGPRFVFRRVHEAVRAVLLSEITTDDLPPSARQALARATGGGRQAEEEKRGSSSSSSSSGWLSRLMGRGAGSNSSSGGRQTKEHEMLPLLRTLR